MTTNFLSITGIATAETDIKKSKFITTVKRVNNDNEAQEFIANIKEQHSKANHNCFAYVIGQQDQIQRESDNGEPSGTAGVPILDAIKNENLHNVAVVVTRYFGGIKLGAGGLIRAYSNAATNGLQTADWVTEELRTELILTIPYAANDRVQYFLTAHNLLIQHTKYTSKVTMTVAVPNEQLSETKAQLTNLLNGNAEFKTGNEKYFAIPYKKPAD